jgi:hypothetical protein
MSNKISKERAILNAVIKKARIRRVRNSTGTIFVAYYDVGAAAFAFSP